MSTMQTINEAISSRVRDADLAAVLSDLVNDAVLEAPAAQQDADTIADVAGLLVEMGDDHADHSGTAEDIVDRAADAHYARHGLIDTVAYLQDEEGGDHWGIAQEMKRAGRMLEGVARDVA